MPHIDVDLPDQPYSVIIEPNALEGVGARMAGSIVGGMSSGPTLMVVDDRIADDHGVVAGRSLQAAGFQTKVVRLVAEESLKTLDTVRTLYDAMLESRLERSSPVVAIGGGIVGDVAGFAAATYLRGVPLIQVPTTLLAMVDAAIGGKTGVNYQPPGLSRPAKNMIGAFWQPKVVVADPLVLRTLDDRHLRSGLAESVKHGLIADPQLPGFIEDNRDAIMARDPQVLTRLITRSAAVKCGIVVRDVREAGPRALLNLGHTFAHVIEPIGELNLHHGEAVAVGLAAAARCSVEIGRWPGEKATDLEQLLTRLGLPIRLSRPVPAGELLEAMRYDKKAGGGRIRLVLPTVHGVQIVDDVPDAAVLDVWRQLGAE